MNLRQPYEQLIADKLRKLPSPDADASWQQMKRLLDEDDETRGGGRKRPPGGGWWRTGIVAIVLMTSLWLYVEKTKDPAAVVKNNAVAPVKDNKTSAEKENAIEKSSLNTNEKATIDKNTTLKTPVSAPGNHINGNYPDSKSVQPATANVPPFNRSYISPNDSIKISGSYTWLILASKTNKKTRLHQSAGNAPFDNTIAGSSYLPANNKRAVQHGPAGKTGNPVNSGTDLADGQAGIAGIEENIHSTSGNAPVDDGYTNTRKSIATKHNKKSIPEQDDMLTSNAGPSTFNAATGKDWLGSITGLKISSPVPAANTALLADDSLAAMHSTGNLLNAETKKIVAKAQRDKAIEVETRKDKKSFHLDLSNVFKPFSLHMDAEPRWAAGISLNSSITLNAQNRFNYNMNGKSGTLTDYIPSLYLQFHLNDYVYMQTELNFISPQYTPQLLVYQQAADLQAQAGTSQQKSIYIQKLYYFNLPVSFHYSPINNLYFSAGLQFSSFQSGLASIQEKQYATASGPDHPNNITTDVLKFKDDSIAAKLAPNEWRWQVGADYYWNRFSIGMRYNRSFKDLRNVDVSSSLPPTTLRNESLIFFVRYNLFESRKK